MSETESMDFNYLVPVNVATRFEFFEGFGWKEFFIVTSTLVVSLLIFYVLGLFTTTVFVPVDELSQMQLQNFDETLVVNELYPIKKEIVPLLFRVLMVIIPTAFSFFLFYKDPSVKVSLFENISYFLAFKKKQKRYYYVQESGDR